MKLKLITSKDGSHTLWREDIKEHYHSTHGAIQESLHVFISKGLKDVSKSKQNISILEIGFGTGLNAFLTSITNDCNISYTGIEAYPIIEEVINQLNYPSQIKQKEIQNNFKKIHLAPWEEFSEITPGFHLKKIEGTIQAINLEKEYDLVYYDAFGPVYQSEMWDISIFKKIYNAMNIGGVFVTYCAKGQVRRDLQSIGFIVERLQGPPGKREMLRGRKL